MAEPSPSSSRDYWLFQLGGWGCLTLVAILSSLNDWNEAALRFVLAKTMCMVSGLLLSHMWRLFLRWRGWIDRQGTPPMKGIVAGVLVLAMVQTGVLAGADVLFRRGALLAEDEKKKACWCFCFCSGACCLRYGRCATPPFCRAAAPRASNWKSCSSK